MDEGAAKVLWERIFLQLPKVFQRLYEVDGRDTS